VIVCLLSQNDNTRRPEYYEQQIARSQFYSDNTSKLHFSPFMGLENRK